MNNLRNDYFEWMYRIVKQPNADYRDLLRCLDNIDFYYILPRDDNREGDGIELRYQFGYEYDISQSKIAEELDNRPCSVLEMMVALARRIEIHIMYDPEYGDRTADWFGEMLDNLDLSYMTDGLCDQKEVETVIHRFLERDYARTGDGGLFVIKDPPRDMRDVEIWCQAMWYINGER